MGCLALLRFNIFVGNSLQTDDAKHCEVPNERQVRCRFDSHYSSSEDWLAFESLHFVLFRSPSFSTATGTSNSK